MKMEKAAHPANPATDRNAETKKTSTAQRNVGEISNLAPPPWTRPAARDRDG